MRQQYENEVRRLAELAQGLIQLSGHSYRDLEAAAGIEHNTLTRVLRGASRMQLWHLLFICDQLGITPAEFFVKAAPGKRWPGRSRLMKKVEALLGEPGAPPVEVSDEFVAQVHAALTKLFASGKLLAPRASGASAAPKSQSGRVKARKAAKAGTPAESQSP
jgi:hypothetical protein